ncbi:MAG: hypothetical protein HQK57_10175 [Deltaproteobacteria bacterium]|nr:hypothetical protein [Deltaproteobacteria bacterium]
MKIKNKRKQKHIYSHIINKVIRQNIAKPEHILIEPPGFLKMSKVLLDFIEPYSNYWDTEEELYQLLTVAIIAWNESLLSGAKRSKSLKEAIECFPIEMHDSVQPMINKMIRRKEKHFADIRREIVDFKITMTIDGPHVSVMSSLDSSYPPLPNKAAKTFRRICEFIKRSICFSFQIFFVIL